MALKYAISGTDPYSIIGLPRQFYFDSNVLEEAFRRAASQVHPDQATGSTAAFQRLQEAAAILRDPAKRLRYLAGISEPRSLSLPSAATEFFSLVIDCLEKTDPLIKKYQATTAALAKALLSQELLQRRRSVRQALEKISNWESSLHHQLQAWDASNQKPSSTELLELASQFTFAQRWLQQLSERDLLLKTVAA